ncbi:hypothetical protein Pelo_19182 [Pelomyxa schiedti]|nr:hypothetical protein Pelo_19182 [Pelomyxa schiedti]
MTPAEDCTEWDSSFRSSRDVHVVFSVTHTLGLLMMPTCARVDSSVIGWIRPGSIVGCSYEIHDECLTLAIVGKKEKPVQELVTGPDSTWWPISVCNRKWIVMSPRGSMALMVWRVVEAVSGPGVAAEKVVDWSGLKWMRNLKYIKFFSEACGDDVEFSDLLHMFFLESRGDDMFLSLLKLDLRNLRQGSVECLGAVYAHHFSTGKEGSTAVGLEHRAHFHMVG